jgi:hypothetical protein
MLREADLSICEPFHRSGKRSCEPKPTFILWIWAIDAFVGRQRVGYIVSMTVFGVAAYTNRQQRRHTAWTALLIMLFQLVLPMTPASGHSLHGDQAAMPQAGKVSSHHHCMDTRQQPSDLSSRHSGGFCQHCQNGVCYAFGCVPAALTVSDGWISTREVLSPPRITLVSSACSADSLYRPPIAL